MLIRLVQKINIVIRQLGEQDLKKTKHLRVVSSLVRIALPCDQLEKIMHKIRICRRERNIRYRECLNEFLIGIKPYPVILIRLSRQIAVVFPVSRSKEDNRSVRILP